MFTTIISVLLTAFLATLGWLFRRVEKQLDSHETRLTILETRQDPLQDYLKIRFDSVEQRLGRIEISMDKEKS